MIKVVVMDREMRGWGEEMMEWEEEEEEDKEEG